MRINICKTILLIVSYLMCPQFCWAASKEAAVKAGNALFAKQDFTGAVGHYQGALKKDQESDRINFDLGTAYHKAGQYDQADEHLQKSLLTRDDHLRQKAYYNLGSNDYRRGIAREDKNIGQAVGDLEKSLDAYQQAIGLDSKDEDAKANLDFVKKELQRLKEKQKKAEQNQQNKDQGKQGEQEQQDKSQSGNSSQKQQEGQGQKSSSENTSTGDQQSQEKSSADSQAEKEKKNNESRQGQQQATGDGGEKKNLSSTSSTGQDQARDPKELTSQEAQMMLNQYQKKEEPLGLLQFVPGLRREQPVAKDW